MRTSEVRGPQAFSRQAGVAVESAAFLADFGIICLVFFASLRVFRFSPVPTWGWLLWISALFVIAWAIQKKWLHRTAGEALWRLRPLPLDQHGKHFGLYQTEQYHPATIAAGIFLTLLVWGAAYGVADGAYSSDPRWLRSSYQKIPPFLPDLAASAPSALSWVPVPFFYTLGTWPKTYQGQPVLHSLPYEKGPPNRFLGRIVARWQNPDIELTFEGPKTPDAQMERKRIRRCLGPSWSSPLLDWSCMKVRETVLSRHVEEIAKTVSEKNPIMEWTLRWFTVENPALNETERPQGFFVRAKGNNYFQSRFVVVSASGTNQAFILNARTSPEGDEAQRVLESSIGSLRVLSDLTQGRSWIDKQLLETDLSRLFKEQASASVVARLALVQAMLLARLSVEPKTFDTYYHLAGTAMLLLRHAKTQQLHDWALTAKPLIHSAYQYALDVAPQDPRLPKLQGLWFESKKFK